MDDSASTVDEAPGYEFQFGRTMRLLVRGIATSADLALLVIGTALVGLAVVVLLDGFEIIDSLALTESTGAMLSSGLVIAVIGGFAIGVAVEGPIRTQRSNLTFNHHELAAARAVGLLATSIGVLLLAGYLRRFTTDLPVPFTIGLEILKVVGSTGWTVILLAVVPLAWAARHFRWRELSEDWELGTVYAAWILIAMSFVAPRV